MCQLSRPVLFQWLINDESNLTDDDSYDINEETTDAFFLEFIDAQQQKEEEEESEEITVEVALEDYQLD